MCDAEACVKCGDGKAALRPLVMTAWGHAGCHCPRRIFGLPFDLRAAWTVDACLLPAGASGAATTAASGGSGSSSSARASGSGVLFLDIVQREDWAGDSADRERFMKWGYRCALLQPAAARLPPVHGTCLHGMPAPRLCA